MKVRMSDIDTSASIQDMGNILGYTFLKGRGVIFDEWNVLLCQSLCFFLGLSCLELFIQPTVRRLTESSHLRPNLQPISFALPIVPAFAGDSWV